MVERFNVVSILLFKCACCHAYVAITDLDCVSAENLVYEQCQVYNF